MNEEDIPNIPIPTPTIIPPEPKRSVWWKIKRKLGIRQIRIKEGICPMCSSMMETWLGKPAVAFSLEEKLYPHNLSEGELMEYYACPRCSFRIEI